MSALSLGQAPTGKRGQREIVFLPSRRLQQVSIYHTETHLLVNSCVPKRVPAHHETSDMDDMQQPLTRGTSNSPSFKVLGDGSFNAVILRQHLALVPAGLFQVWQEHAELTNFLVQLGQCGGMCVLVAACDDLV